MLKCVIIHVDVYEFQTTMIPETCLKSAAGRRSHMHHYPSTAPPPPPRIITPPLPTPPPYKQVFKHFVA